MAEQKTQPTDASVEDFIDRATPQRRVDEGHELDRIMREVTGALPVMWGPSIVGYGQFNYQSPVNERTRGIWPKVGFSPRKGAISLYGLKDQTEQQALLPQLGGYTEGAGCVYVKRLDQVDHDVLRELIRIAWQIEDDW